MMKNVNENFLIIPLNLEHRTHSMKYYAGEHH